MTTADMKLNVRPTENGTWAVTDGRNVLKEFDTNAAAWRWLERQTDQPLSPMEDRQMYGFRKFVNGE